VRRTVKRYYYIINDVIVNVLYCLQPIVIGRDGKIIKAIASEAVSDLESALGRTVKLFLYVKALK